MKHIIKTICAVAASFLIFAALTSAVFADTTNGIAVSQTELDQGDEFTVSLIVPPTEDADTASVKVKYDDTVFEGIEFAPTVSGSFSNLSNGIMALSAANAERAIRLGDGLTLTARMKVRDNAPDGVYDFVLTENSFCYLDDETWEFVELWFPDTTKVSVTVGAPDTAAAVTAESQSTEMTTAAETAPETTAGTAGTEKAAPMSSSDGVFVVIVIILIAVVVCAIVVTVITLFKHKKHDQ